MSARDTILDAAETCLRRDGIRRTTVRGVAEEAGLSRAYVYRFFPDKFTLLSAALIRRDSAVWQAAYAEVMGTYVHELVPGLLDFWVEHLGAAQERGLVRADLDVEAAAEWVIRVLASLVGVPGRTVDADDPDSLRATLATFLAPALEPARLGP